MAKCIHCGEGAGIGSSEHAACKEEMAAAGLALTKGRGGLNLNSYKSDEASGSYLSQLTEEQAKDLAILVGKTAGKTAAWMLLGFAVACGLLLALVRAISA